MGNYLYDVREKSYRVIAQPSLTRLYDDKAVPALTAFQDAINKFGNEKGKPTKITITVQGKEDFTFSIEIEDLSEIQEILQWTIGGKD